MASFEPAFRRFAGASQENGLEHSHATVPYGVVLESCPEECAPTVATCCAFTAARDAASAAKVTIKLGHFPIIDEATHALRTARNVEWTAAPPAGRAAVWSGVWLDSYALGTTAPPPKKWPKWRGRPTIVAHPLTDMDGVQLATTKPWEVLAKKLVHGEKLYAKKRKREQEGCDSEEEEEEESREEESG